jgi:uncharacterized membrane protein
MLRNVLWDVFLAFVPVAFAYAAVWLHNESKKERIMQFPLAVTVLLWLAFLPNSCYLLTEWRHFLHSLDAENLFLHAQHDSRWMVVLTFYAALYFAFSTVGMIAFTLAIRPLARIIRCYIPNTWIAAVPLFGMLSVGVYLGLVLRYNSWELITRPGSIWADIVNVGGSPTLVAMILAFGVFLYLAYVAMDMWVDAFVIRWRRRMERRVVQAQC